MTQTLFALSLGFVGLILATQAGFAAPQCGPRATVLEQLSAKFGETRQGIGLAANTQIMEIFANTETGSWTITVTLPDGMTCLAASGQNFDSINEELPATLKELRQSSANLARVTGELQPRLERVDALLDEADGSVQSLRATIEAAEDLVRGPAAASASRATGAIRPSR